MVGDAVAGQYHPSLPFDQGLARLMVMRPLRTSYYSFHFVRSGYVYRNYGSVRSLGINGYGWSPTASPVHYSGSVKLTGYYLGLDDSGVYPSLGPDYRWHAFPVRCLAY